MAFHEKSSMSSFIFCFGDCDMFSFCIIQISYQIIHCLFSWKQRGFYQSFLVCGGGRDRETHTHREKHMPVCMSSLAKPSCVSSITLHLVPLRQGLSLNLQAGWWLTIPSEPSASARHGNRITNAFEVITSFLNSGPHAVNQLLLPIHPTILNFIL